MDQESVVTVPPPNLAESQINAGRLLVVAMDDKGISPKAALWYLEPEADRWQLLLAFRETATSGPRKLYKSVQDLLVGPESWAEALSLEDVVVLHAGHDLLQLLRVALTTGEGGVGGIRFTANTINGVYIRDAYIYRLT